MWGVRLSRIVCVILLFVGMTTACGRSDEGVSTRPDATEFSAPAPPPKDPSDPLDFEVRMQFQGGADVAPTSYSYSRCPYSDADKCLGAAENWQSQDRAQFDWVQTAQFGIDAGSLPTSITLKDSKGTRCVRALQRDQVTDLAPSGGQFTYGVSYPDKPEHITFIPNDCSGKFESGRAVAVWISPRNWSNPPSDAVICDLKNANPPIDYGAGWSDGDCTINKPMWRFNKNRSAILFTGTIWDMLDKPQKNIFINVEEGLSLYAPLTNEYVEYSIQDQTGCDAAVDALNRNQTPQQGQCSVTLSGVFTRPTDKNIIVTGFGRISGGRVLSGVRNSPPQLSWDKMDLATASSAAQYHVWSSLLGVSSASSSDPAIDVSSVTVAWGPKRGQSAVNLNTIAMKDPDTGQPWDNNKPVKLFDVKMPSNWIDAADGPEVGADGSDISFVYLLVADDSIKIAAQRLSYQEATVLQGNAGGVINLGSYGYNRGITGSTVSGVWVHRITHNLLNGKAQDDDRGGIVTSRTCPMSPLGKDAGTGANLEGATVENLYVPKLGTSQGINSVTRPIAIGVSGSGSTDRDVFCDKNRLATGGFRVGGDGQTNPLTFTNFQIYPNPLSDSLLYNEPPSNVGVNWGQIKFYTGDDPPPGGQVDKSEAVTLHGDDDNAYFVCGYVKPADASAKCFNGKGVGGAPNLQYEPDSSIFGTGIYFPSN